MQSTRHPHGVWQRFKNIPPNVALAVVSAFVVAMLVLLMLIPSSEQSQHTQGGRTPPPAPATSALRQQQAPSTRVNTGHGAEPQWPPPPPANLTSPAGRVAYAFIVPFNHFSPAVPNNGQVWLNSWRDYTTEKYAVKAASNFHRQWLFTWQNSVKTHMPVVTAAKEVWRDKGAVTYRITVERALVPLMHPDRPTTTQTVTWDVVVANTGSEWLVAGAYPPVPGRVRPPDDVLAQ